MSPETNTNMTSQFNEDVQKEIADKAMKTLRTHPARILEPAIYATNRIFVGSPEDDPADAKLANTVALLRNLADALEADGNPLEFEFNTNEDGTKYTGGYKLVVTSEIAADMLIPVDMVTRSYRNRVKAAAKRVTS